MQNKQVLELLEPLEIRTSGGIASAKACREHRFGAEQLYHDMQQEPIHFYVRGKAKNIANTLKKVGYEAIHLKNHRDTLLSNESNTGMSFGDILLVYPQRNTDTLEIQDLHPLYLDCIGDTSWKTLAEAHICPLNSIQQDTQGSSHDPLEAMETALETMQLKVSPNASRIIDDNPAKVSVYHQSAARFHYLSPEDIWDISRSHLDIPNLWEHLLTDYERPVRALASLVRDKKTDIPEFSMRTQDRMESLIQHQDPMNPEIWKLARKMLFLEDSNKQETRLTLRQQIVKHGLETAQARIICEATLITERAFNEPDQPPYSLSNIRERIQSAKTIADSLPEPPNKRIWRDCDLTHEQQRAAQGIAWELWFQSNLTLTENKIPVRRIAKIAKTEPQNIQLVAKRIWNHDPEISV